MCLFTTESIESRGQHVLLLNILTEGTQTNLEAPYIFNENWQIVDGLVWFGLVGFYGISIIVGYLMPNPVFTYILNIWFVNTFWR